jgi:hypothetical protein
MPVSSSEAQIRHIYEKWHDTVTARDLEGVLALYAEDATMETPAILALVDDSQDAMLKGRSEIRKLFANFFQVFRPDFRELYRTGLFFANGQLLTWEYPRKTPHGEQLDLFESMDIENGLIAYHRVYWGWKGFRALMAARDRRNP